VPRVQIATWIEFDVPYSRRTLGAITTFQWGQQLSNFAEPEPRNAIPRYSLEPGQEGEGDLPDDFIGPRLRRLMAAVPRPGESAEIIEKRLERIARNEDPDEPSPDDPSPELVAMLIAMPKECDDVYKECLAFLIGKYSLDIASMTKAKAMLDSARSFLKLYQQQRSKPPFSEQKTTSIATAAVLSAMEYNPFERAFQQRYSGDRKWFQMRAQRMTAEGKRYYDNWYFNHEKFRFKIYRWSGGWFGSAPAGFDNYLPLGR
jgi:hypothetical protein